jgi:hypothetical protein
MNLFAQLRIVVLLRRGVRALESLAVSQNAIAVRLNQQQQRRSERLARRRNPRPTEFGILDTNEIQRRYDEQLKREQMERG